VYSDADRARRVGGSDRPGRTAFQRDRARVLHSMALRRLAGKTQVVEPLTMSAAAPRTRLTHSLECAQVGRELGAALGCDPDLVDAACLAHDLGHPPFGHNGETALDEAAQPCGGFEGNAQSFRVLVRLEVKVPGAGLDLTRGALDAATKYPWSRRPDRRKYGVYADDLEAFRWVRAGAPGERRCLESQVMDWADDVAYSVHDLEDGLLAGHVRLDTVDVERDEIAALAAQVYSGLPASDLRAVLDGLLEDQLWPRGYDGSLAAMTALKAATSGLISRFSRAAEAATVAASGPDLSRYSADLVVPERERAECALLKAVAARYVMERPGVRDVQERERAVVIQLVERLSGRPEELGVAAAEAWKEASDDAGRLRAVVDQVASLTDAAAHHLHGRLSPA
jgi:dGTPase